MTTEGEDATVTSPLWRNYERLVHIMAGVAAAILVFATLLVLTEICSRYFLRRPILGAIEITEYCLVWATFLAAPWVQLRGANVKVEFIIDQLSPKYRAMLRAVSAFLAAIACAILTYAGFETVWSHYSMGYDLATPLHPPSALIICVIPISTLFLTIQFLRETVSLWREVGE